MKTTKFRTVADAAAHLAEDPAVAQRVMKEISRNQLVSTLLELRIQKGLTQEQVAGSMGIDASTVSRMESDNDRQLKWSDIVGYLNAINIRMNILFDDPSLPAADRIKQCVFKIHEDLESLSALAKEVGGEDEITKAIDGFYRQVLFNFLIRFQESYSKLSAVINIPPQSKPALPAESTQPGEPQNYTPAELAGK